MGVAENCCPGGERNLSVGRCYVPVTNPTGDTILPSGRSGPGRRDAAHNADTARAALVPEYDVRCSDRSRCRSIISCSCKGNETQVRSFFPPHRAPRYRLPGSDFVPQEIQDAPRSRNSFNSSMLALPGASTRIISPVPAFRTVRTSECTEAKSENE